ncbi:MAG: hypothetical protein L3K19_07700 [Thermoplasmata archaeon]|nr:hypothetical protein [Thermoplasmata archaeon]
MTDPPLPDPNRSDGPTLLVAIAGAGLLADGLAMGLAGTGALLPAGSGSPSIPILLASAGVAALGFALFRLGHRVGQATGAHAPRLFPLAPLWVQLGVYFVIVLTAVAVFQGTFETFTSAHNGGDLSAAPNRAAADGLVAAASGLLWVLTLYTILVVRRVIGMGRRIDAVAGTDAYGTGPMDSDPPPLSVPRRLPAVRRPPVPIRFVFASTLLLALSASVAVQTLEVGTLPAPALDWLSAQLALPVWIGVVSSGISAADRGIRDLEWRFTVLRPVSTGSGTPPTPSG